MSNLKTNWAIRTTDEQFKAYILTLEALGYHLDGDLYYGSHTRMFASDKQGVFVKAAVVSSYIKTYQDISSFLVYHFSEEKTEAEKELEALQEKMNSLQEQIDRVKLSISK